jgi:hypothetical protein
MSTKIKEDFTFLFVSHGHYKVTYQSPKTGKKWTKTINDVPLIEMIKNNGSPKRKDLETLKFILKV